MFQQQTIDRLARPADADEFARIAAAGRGTFRTERGDDYVIIAHCHTAERIELVLIRDTRWYVSVNYKGDPIARGEFNAAELTYDALDAFITGVIAQHQR